MRSPEMINVGKIIHISKNVVKAKVNTDPNRVPFVNLCASPSVTLPGKGPVAYSSVATLSVPTCLLFYNICNNTALTNLSNIV